MAIPKHLLNKARLLNRHESLSDDKTAFLLTLLSNTDLYKTKCKDYYWLYISASACTAMGPQKWEKELNLESIDWKTKFTNTRKKELYTYVLNDRNINLLLTECEGCTGEYWYKVTTVRTKHREVRAKMTEGQYSTVRLEQARLVSSLLYGTQLMLYIFLSNALPVS